MRHLGAPLTDEQMVLLSQHFPGVWPELERDDAESIR